MTEPAKKNNIKIRTFAGDLEIERKRREEAEKIKENPKPSAPPRPTINIPIMPTSAPKEAEVVKPVAKSTIPQYKKENDLPLIKVIESEIKATENFTIENQKTNNGVTKIPAFHELQKKQVTTIKEDIIATTQENEPKQVKEIVNDLSNSSKVNIDYDATVITDTKSDRFKLLPSVVTSVKGWFETQKVKRKRKKIPTYSVPETQRRKGVIQKATSQSATLFTADSETIKEQIRQRRLQEKNENNNDNGAAWSPFTEAGFNLLESENTPQNITVEFKKTPSKQILNAQKTDFVTEKEVIEPVIPRVNLNTHTNTPTQPNIKKVLPEEEKVTESRWSSTQTTTKSFTINPKPVIKSSELIIDKEVIPVKKEEKVPEPIIEMVIPEEKVPEPESYLTPIPQQPIIDKHESENKTSDSSFIDKFDTNKTIIILSILVIILITIIIGSRFLINNLPNEDSKMEVPTLEINFTPILDKSVTKPITIGLNDLNNVSDLIKSNIQSGPAGIVELALFAPDNNELTGSYIFNLLHFRTIPNLRESLLNARFISINHSDPVILLNFVDVDTVRGGLLQWEANMAMDMDNLYEIPYGVEPYFNDTTISNISVRTLTYQDKVILVYGIINDNTAIITNSTESFAQIVE